MYAVIQSTEESRLLEAGRCGRGGVEPFRHEKGFQDVLTIMVVTLVVAIFVSVLRGKDPPHTAGPHGGRGMGAPATQRRERA